MFNIFKKFVKKEEKGNLKEQNFVDFEEENSDKISKREEAFNCLEEIYPKEQFDIEDVQEPEVQEVSQLDEYDFEVEAEEPAEEVFSIEQLETEDFEEPEVQEIAQVEEYDFEVEAEEPAEEEVFSLEQLETEDFEEPEVQEVAQFDEYDFEVEAEAEEPAEEEIFSIDQLETEDFEEQEVQEIPQIEEHDFVIENEEPVIEEAISIEQLETVFDVVEAEEVPQAVYENLPSEPEEEPVAKSLFGISFAGLKEAVSKTSEFFNTNILSLGVGKEEIDDDLLDEMEEKFIRADVGVDTTVYIIERLRENKNKIKPNKLGEYLKNEFKEIIKAPGSNTLNLKKDQLNTFLITGVNGAGKTTLIGKLAYRFKLEGKKVLVAAGDTFRAAAEDQLEIWADRAGADIVRQDGADPASVVFDSIKKAQSENYDILLIDTAGRLHNKFNLMEELRKIKKVIDKESPESLVESILVLDATTGQNGLKQAEVFKEAVDITSVGLTKLDGTAKGGVILGIARQLNLPVKLIGVGEKMEDLKDFSADDFIDALF